MNLIITTGGSGFVAAGSITTVTGSFSALISAPLDNLRQLKEWAAFALEDKTEYLSPFE